MIFTAFIQAKQRLKQAKKQKSINHLIVQIKALFLIILFLISSTLGACSGKKTHQTHDQELSEAAIQKGFCVITDFHKTSSDKGAISGRFQFEGSEEFDSGEVHIKHIIVKGSFRNIPLSLYTM